MKKATFSFFHLKKKERKANGVLEERVQQRSCCRKFRATDLDLMEANINNFQFQSLTLSFKEKIIISQALY